MRLEMKDWRWRWGKMREVERFLKRSIVEMAKSRFGWIAALFLQG